MIFSDYVLIVLTGLLIGGAIASIWFLVEDADDE